MTQTDVKVQTWIPPTTQETITTTQDTNTATSTMMSNPTIPGQQELLATVTIVVAAQGTELSVTDDKLPSEIT